MSAGLSAASELSQRRTASISRPGLLLSLAAEAVAIAAGFPFDAVLAGMVAAGQGIQAICLYLGLSRAALDDHLARLGLKAPNDRPPRKAGPRSWSELDTRRLIAWRVCGIHPETIGERLGRSANAVRAKARRLGIPKPDRKALQRVDPATLQDPVAGFGRSASAAFAEPSAKSRQAVCGTAAGPVGVRADNAGGAATSSSPVGESGRLDRRKAAPAAGDRGGPAVFGATSSIEPGRTADPGSRLAPPPVSGPRGGNAAIGDGDVAGSAKQAELPLFPVAEPLARIRLAPDSAGPPAPTGLGPAGRRLGHPVPQKQEAVCLSGDLTWIGTLRTRARNMAAVWVVGMLRFGGLDRWAIAQRTGMTPAAARTFLSRVGVPVDRDHKKFGAVFDEECARETEKRSGFEVVAEKGVDDSRKEYFWCHKKDRAAVTRKRGYRLATGRLERYQSEVINVVTRAELAAERGLSRATRDHPGSDECCWPIGHPGTADFHFCDRPVVTGKPYCETHCRRAYVRPRAMAIEPAIGARDPCAMDPHA